MQHLEGQRGQTGGIQEEEREVEEREMEHLRRTEAKGRGRAGRWSNWVIV